MQVNPASVLRLKAIVEAEPGALVHVLEQFQRRHVVPRTVASQRVGNVYLEIYVEIDSADLSTESFRVAVAKIKEFPVVLAAAALEADEALQSPDD